MGRDGVAVRFVSYNWRVAGSNKPLATPRWPWTRCL